MIGILGGTFDPVHIGHLHIANELLQQIPFTEIRFLPCYQPVHRDQPGATAEQRLSMLELALTNQTKLTIDLRELERKGESFMIDTLHSFRTEFPEESLVIVIGADAFTFIESWHLWQQLIDFAHIVIVDRPGTDPKTPVKWQSKVITDPAQLSQQPAGLIYFANIETCDISATAIRQKIAANEDISGLVTTSVAQYIKAHGLYQ